MNKNSNMKDLKDMNDSIWMNIVIAPHPGPICAGVDETRISIIDCRQTETATFTKLGGHVLHHYYLGQKKRDTFYLEYLGF